MSKEQFSVTGRTNFGTEMKKYAKCTLFASILTLILGGALQFLWFKYDAILREGWLRISYAGYTSEEEPWISFFQSPITEKIIPVCSFITLGILLLYMTYDVLRDINAGIFSDGKESILKRFLNKFTAVGIFSAISTVLLIVAGFFGNGCLTYDNGLYQLQERSFLPIGGYTYDQVWTKYPSVNVKYYVFAFLMVMFVFLCLYLVASLVSGIASLSSKLINISTLGMLFIAVAIVLMAHTSNVIIFVLVSLLLIGNIALAIVTENKSGNRQQMA
ncbi:MAG: hypothetical protein J5752_09685 [Clostridiales bacterium]|nr:hypothetical protein [Clostridiales bacterium]